MLLDIYKFRENLRREGRSFLTDVNEITLTSVPSNPNFGNKECLGKNFVLNHGLCHLQSCYIYSATFTELHICEQ